MTARARQFLALTAVAFSGAVAVAGEGLVALPAAEVSSAWTPKTFLGPLSGDKVYAARDLERPIELNLDGLRNPFFLDREYPLADRADYAAWKAAHPNCLGVCALNEYDGEVNNDVRRDRLPELRYIRPLRPLHGDSRGPD